MLSKLAFPGFFPTLVSQSHNLYYHFQNQKSNLNSNSNSNPHHFPQTPLPSNPIQQPTPSMAQSASPPHSNANNLHFPQTLFSQIQNPNIFAQNLMFKAYSHSNNNSNTIASPQQCISLYNLMRCHLGLFLDRHSFPFLFKGQELYSLTFKLGLQHDVFVQTFCFPCTPSAASFTMLTKSSMKYHSLFAMWCLGIVWFLGVYKDVVIGMP